MNKDIYVLGTGLSHDGSACLLKNGRICVAIEKERITRVKHDGGNDSAAINYCLRAEGISIGDVDLIVQNANFGAFKAGSEFYKGYRPFHEGMGIPTVTISHHLAHAYSAIGTCPFDEFNVLVMDGCGNSFDDAIDDEGAVIPDRERIALAPHLFHEKDSFYLFSDMGCRALVKDYSEWGYGFKNYPLHPHTTMHSIGGLYMAVSIYCFGNIDDPGKLMGLGPYGRPGVLKERVFELRDGRVFVNYDWMRNYSQPARSFDDFKRNFQYYSDIAYGIQEQVEEAILYLVGARMETGSTGRLCYSGGTALNAVANAKLLALPQVDELYIEPAAGDNGLAIGCAFYGWLEVLKKERVKHNGSTCFGITYPDDLIKEEIGSYVNGTDPVVVKRTMDLFFSHLNRAESAAPGVKANIQFNIENYGVFQILYNGSVRSSNQIVGKPTCIVNVAGDDFYKALVRPKAAEEIFRSGKIRVSNGADLELFVRTTDFEGFSRIIKEQLKDDPFGDTRAVNYRRSEDPARDGAELLAAGKVIGWFQEGSEFGPRALGRRSILADPRLAGVRDHINRNIKFREDFRPFAPSVLREDVSTYFEHDRESPYMILVDNIRPAYREMLKSVVHENNTSRTQTVTAGWAGRYHQLLTEFKRLTGVAVLLNTSFNRRGMPIVETPRDAIDFFFSCALDSLVIGNFIIEKAEPSQLKSFAHVHSEAMPV
jgi:predicted NodU family carbamoyl transferase